ncbi:MAG: cupin domain-containing protein [Crocinitomicaceae bacterium]
MSKFNIHQKLAQINDHWNPRIAAELNGQYVKLAKLKGKFTWHKHDHEDELFMVVKGNLEIHFRDRIEKLSAGDCLVIPKGEEHLPVAKDEVEVLLFEPKSTLNTGDQQNDFTKENLENI